jgi:flap endonuclease-1
MGIKGLRKIIYKKYKNDTVTVAEMSAWKGSRVAHDIATDVHRYVHSSPPNEFYNHIFRVTGKIITLMDQGLFPVIVFDGKHPEAKNEAHTKRREAKQKRFNKFLEQTPFADKHNCRLMEKDVVLPDEDPEMHNHAPVFVSPPAHTDGNGNVTMIPIFTEVTQTHFEQLKEWLIALGIPTVTSPDNCEAEGFAAWLQQKKAVHKVLSDDFDVLVFGSDSLLTWAPPAASKSGDGGAQQQTNPTDVPMLTEIHTDKVVNAFGFDTFEQLVNAAVIMGSDLNEGGVHGVGPVNALKHVKNCGNDLEKTIHEIVTNTKHNVDKENQLNVAKRLFFHTAITTDMAMGVFHNSLMGDEDQDEVDRFCERHGIPHTYGKFITGKVKNAKKAVADMSKEWNKCMLGTHPVLPSIEAQLSQTPLKRVPALDLSGQPDDVVVPPKPPPKPKKRTRKDIAMEEEQSLVSMLMGGEDDDTLPADGDTPPEENEDTTTTISDKRPRVSDGSVLVQ